MSEIVKKITEYVNEAGGRVFYVGGCVRDRLLGIDNKDVDIEVHGISPEDLYSILEKVGEPLAYGKSFGVFALRGEDIDIAMPRRERAVGKGHRDFVVDVDPFIGTREAARRRDFTINALMENAMTGEIVDHFGGQEDLAERVLRCVGRADDRLREDALRILRALRFCARYGLAAEPETDAALRRNRARLGNVSAERIFSELKGILTAPGAGRMMLSYPEIFFTVFPEMEPMLGFDQHRPDAHIYDVWEHTAHAVDEAPDIAEVRLALFFHDCGKPSTFTADPDTGRGHFYTHPGVSARMADAMLRGMKSDTATRETVTALVENHEIKPGANRKALRRLLRRLGPDTVLLLYEVRRADAMAHAPELAARLAAELEAESALLREILAEENCFTVKDLAVSGRDMISLGLSPGPEIGAVLDVLLGEVTDETLPNERSALLKRAEEMLRQK